MLIPIDEIAKQEDLTREQVLTQIRERVRIGHLIDGEWFVEIEKPKKKRIGNFKTFFIGAGFGFMLSTVLGFVYPADGPGMTKGLYWVALITTVIPTFSLFGGVLFLSVKLYIGWIANQKT